MGITLQGLIIMTVYMAMYFKIHEFIRDLRQFIINLKSTKKIQHRYKEDERKSSKAGEKKRN